MNSMKTIIRRPPVRVPVSWHRYSLAVLVVLLSAGLAAAGKIDQAAWVTVSLGALSTYTVSNTVVKWRSILAASSQQPHQPSST